MYWNKKLEGHIFFKIDQLLKESDKIIQDEIEKEETYFKYIINLT